MRIGLFGGTFDPVHLGHLILAEQCRDQLQLEQVWFVPSAYPPHKPGQRLTRFEQRCDMLELAIAGHPAFRVERIEKELPPPSYTAETLAALHRRLPGQEWFLLLGADGLADLPQWYQPQRIVAQAALAVVPRGGLPLATAAELAAALGVEAGQVRLYTVAAPRIEIASRELRQAVAEGRTIRYLVPRAVEEYIRERRLYQGAPPPSAG